MANDTITLRLDGEVSLADFSKAMAGFTALAKALADAVGGPKIQWVVADLDWSSTIATAQGRADDPAHVERAVGAYATVGAYAARNEPIPYPQTVITATGTILSVLRGGADGGVDSIDFETADSEATVRARPVTSIEHKATVQPHFGAVTGRVQALSNRGSLRFTLYDLLHDKAVSCYMAEGRESIMVDVWGKLAVVEGLVTRDERTGRVKSVRQVRRVSPQAEGEPGGYTIARGASPSLSGLSAGDAIRRIRDA